MADNQAVIGELQKNVSAEWTAYGQYRTQADLCRVWGYEGFAALLDKLAEEEAEHIGELNERLAELGAQPAPAMNAVTPGEDVPQQIDGSLALETQAIADYNESIRVAASALDGDSRVLLEHILSEEVTHERRLKALQRQGREMGIENLLSILASQQAGASD